MKILEQHSQSSWFKSAIVMEEGDYNLSPSKVRGLHVDYIFIPECDKLYYTENSPLYQLLIANTSITDVCLGKY